MNESDDELVIRGFPLVMWSITLFFLGLGFYFIFLGLPTFGSLFNESVTTILMNLIGMLLLPIIGLVLLIFFPLITTKVNRREKSVKIEKLGILGKRVSLYGFDALDGGFRVKSEVDEDDQESLKLCFKLKSGQRVFLSSDVTEYWKGKAYDVAMKANEFLRPRDS